MIVLVGIIFSGLLFSVHCDWHDNFGPWYVPTKGEPWPRPKERILHDGYLFLRSTNFNIDIPEDCEILNEARNRYNTIIRNEGILGAYSTLQHKADVHNSSQNSILFRGMLQRLHITVTETCHQQIPHLYMNESYKLLIMKNTAELTAPTVWGALHGLETFSQLLTPSGQGSNLSVRLQEIKDKPLMSHRGLLLDTSRHWLSLADIMKTLDGMSYNKLNVLHWHIVDDNSFPYQSLAFPELSQKGAWFPSMIYTPNDIRSIIEYARLRGIRVIPEFDSPGHVASWGESHPELLTTCYDDFGKPNGKLGPINPINSAIWPFLTTLFNEIMDLFPDNYIHVGGDEVLFDCWKSNPDILAYMQANGMKKNFEQLESYYIAELLKIPSTYNRSSIVWQEVFDNGVVLSSDIAVHVWKINDWQNEMTQATNAGHPVLLSSCWYLDHVAGGGDWIKYYLCDPFAFDGSDKVKNLVLGGEACMWSEFVDSTNIHQRIWPRASAVAERLWSSNVDTVDHAAQRLEEHACRMRKRSIAAQPPNGPSVCLT
ncbi:hypothetical protein HCN44_007871 [Aphidius gifuensis]|uniref:Beta-hexosaminidase n=1 Tax=Aphidius gifuensis TaxID=684658 RepID=A0A834XVN3_APHGI|nr:hypothetical protein HCN44_007871 [Aphidius gifuensis]